MSGKLPIGAAVARLLAVSHAGERDDLIYVTADEWRARRIAQFLRTATASEVLVFPPWDCLPYDRISPSREIMGERMAALLALAQDREQPRMVITTPDALLQRVPPTGSLRAMQLHVGEEVDIDELRGFCESAGYILDERVDETGEAAFRGEVIDIFPAGSQSPARLEMQNGRIFAIRSYEPLSQRSHEELSSLLITPVSELPVTGRAEAIEDTECQRVKSFPKLETLFDYLPEARLLVEPQVAHGCERLFGMISEAYQDRLTESASRVLPPDRTYLDAAEWSKLVAERGSDFGPLDNIRRVPSLASARRPGRAFANFLNEQWTAGRRIVLAGATEEILERMGRRAERCLDLRPLPVSSWDAIRQSEKPALLSLHAELDEGFLDEDADIVVIAAPDVLGSRVRNGGDARSLHPSVQTEATEFHLGDLVVHIDHGVGVLRGLERVDTPDGPRDAVRLSYANDSVLLVPIQEVDKLWRYGSEEGTVALDRLDSDTWPKRRAKIAATLTKTARAMHANAVKRRQIEAPKLIPPQSAYERFVARFPFTETPDQARAIEAVLEDLASGRPMDRLVVGDVGFGKTEIALRAAAAAAFAGKQVAVVAPTTVLARQHFNLFTRRFADLGIEVAHLSRLAGRKEAASVKKRLADGSVQVVVGTHALTGKNVAFADLGLLVIDEEHRFGAVHKRKLRKLADARHVLTLTATPIPRTLQTALVGLQDISVIATPPARRRPIRTFFLPFDLTTIGAALRRERRRGGQSFVVVPRIEDIEPVAGRLQTIAPDLNLKIAHGKLSPAEIDETMVAFSEGRGDVLLSTSIIESGLDVPAANTIIVLRADLFGLAELHQLRGRVGRGALQAFCYLMTDGEKDLPEATAKRLNTLQAFDQLGAGMQIAARDLDLRGAGDLMGEEQAGHAKLIGVGLYQEVLARALTKARGERSGRQSTVLQIDTPAWVPDEYIPEAETRLNLYYRAARASEPAEIDHLAEEIADRFGPPPPPVLALLDLAAARSLASSLNIVKVVAGPQGVALTFALGSNPREAFADCIAKAKSDRRWNGNRLIYRKTSNTPDKRLNLVMKVLSMLERSDPNNVVEC